MVKEDGYAARSWHLAIPRPRPVPVVALFGLALLLLAGNAFMVLLAFREPDRWLRPAQWLARGTGGVVNLTLSANLLNLAVFVVGVLIFGLRQTPHMLGLRPRRLPVGVAGTLAIFAIATAIQLAFERAQGRPLAWDAAWSAGSWRVALGHWLGQVVGNALFEEIVYRAFFLSQAYLLAGRRLGNRPALRLAFAMVVSQAIFAAIHIPVNAAHGMPPAYLLVQFAMGLVLAGVYLASDNLFLAIGMHTLANEPPMPLASSISSGMVTALLVLILIPILVLRRSRALGDHRLPGHKVETAPVQSEVV